MCDWRVWLPEKSLTVSVTDTHGLPTGSQMEFAIKQSSQRIKKASTLSTSTWITVKFQYCVWKEFICLYLIPNAAISCVHAEDSHHADSNIYFPESDKVWKQDN